VPYGWQFKDEDVAIEVSRGKALNCFGLISRKSVLHFATTTQKITADFILEQLDRFSWHIIKPTVVVLDNARIHTAKKIKERLRYWQKRGLYIFYLPPYSPHLNICERLWKELKARWIKPEDYKNTDTLFYRVNQVLNSVGKELIINFSEFKS
jgi:transposase